MDLQQQAIPSSIAGKHQPLRFKDKDKEMSRSRHSQLVSLLTINMGNHILSKRLGWIFGDPDLKLPNQQRKIRPDIAFIARENRAIVKEIIEGVPDLVVETISASSYEEDTKKKYDLYASAGVKEYWIILPELQTVNVFTLNENKKYQSLCHAYQQGKVFSKVLEGYELDLDFLFAEMF